MEPLVVVTPKNLTEYTGGRLEPHMWYTRCTKPSISDKKIEIKGIVREVLWRNVEIVIAAADAKGRVARWHIEHTNVGACPDLGIAANPCGLAGK